MQFVKLALLFTSAILAAPFGDIVSEILGDLPVTDGTPLTEANQAIAGVGESKNTINNQ
jgi:hypothetical protein